MSFRSYESSSKYRNLIPYSKERLATLNQKTDFLHPLEDSLRRNDKKVEKALSFRFCESSSKYRNLVLEFQSCYLIFRFLHPLEDSLRRNDKK